jgi:hypothetical protein
MKPLVFKRHRKEWILYCTFDSVVLYNSTIPYKVELKCEDMVDKVYYNNDDDVLAVGFETKIDHDSDTIETDDDIHYTTMYDFYTMKSIDDVTLINTDIRYCSDTDPFIDYAYYYGEIIENKYIGSFNNGCILF